jgi:predicted alpha/beta hydrolase family esterase
MAAPTPSSAMPVLLLPGWQNSGPSHWQSLWESAHGDLRVEQHDWMHPLRGDWIVRLEEVLLGYADLGKAPVLLAAHSLGCLLVAAWAAHSRNTHLVHGALLVAPGDPTSAASQGALHSWLPVVQQPLPFPAILVGSQDDPYCSFERARDFAQACGCRFIDYGARGHINADSGLADWPEGRQWLDSLRAPHPTA